VRESDIGRTKVKIDLKDPLHPLKFQSAGAIVGSSSFGQMKIIVPPVTLFSSKEGLETSESLIANGIIDVHLESTVMIDQIQDLFTSILGQTAEVKVSDMPVYPPFPMRLPGLKVSLSDQSIVFTTESIVVASDAIRCDSIKCTGPNDSRCLLKGIGVTFDPAINVRIEMIEDACIPEIAHLAEPIQNVSITLKDESLRIDVDSVKVTMLQGVGGAGAGNNEGCVTMIRVSNINMNLSSADDLLNIDTFNDIQIRVNHANEWVECSLQPSFVALPKTLTA
jgi:hypothetical protein